MKARVLLVPLAAVCVLTLAGCGGSTSSSSSTAASSAAPADSASASAGTFDNCTLLSAADLQKMLGVDPGTGVPTFEGGGTCNYADIQLGFGTGLADGYDRALTKVQDLLTSNGMDTTATPVTGVGDTAVSMGMGGGQTLVLAKDAKFLASAQGPGTVEELSAIVTALFAALNAKS